MPLSQSVVNLIDTYTLEPEALSAIGWMLCFPNRSAYSGDVILDLAAGESIAAAAARERVRWSPQWLFDAGFQAFDAAGQALGPNDPASGPGAIRWEPEVRLARVDDQINDKQEPGSNLRRIRVAGEVAVACLLQRQASRFNIHDFRAAKDLNGNTRGANFRSFLVHLLRNGLPPQWQVQHEVPLTSIRGLHLRRNVGDRKSDIVVLDADKRLVAVVSSKWTWRSDRGTEAAQMVPLRQYRPDVPYTMVTAEFPRAAVVARESVEDSTFHLVPEWAGAWIALQRNDNPLADLPTLDDLVEAGRLAAETIGLDGIDRLTAELNASGTIL